LLDLCSPGAMSCVHTLNHLTGATTGVCLSRAYGRKACQCRLDDSSVLTSCAVVVNIMNKSLEHTLDTSRIQYITYIYVRPDHI
jgi:hypothetical protein